MTDEVRLVAMEMWKGKLVPAGPYRRDEAIWQDAITEEEKDAAIHGEVNDYSVIAKFDAAFNPEGERWTAKATIGEHGLTATDWKRNPEGERCRYCGGRGCERCDHKTADEWKPGPRVPTEGEQG